MKKIIGILMSLLIKYGKRFPDEAYLKIYSKLRTGKNLNFKKPISFNEKINWIKLYERNPNMTICADKLKVRDFIKEKLGEEFLIPFLWYGRNPVDIPFEELPKSFVLKTNNASGTNIIVRNKDDINQNEIINQLNDWLSQDNYTPKREWVYKDIPPRIICEKFIEQENKEELRDYRFFCFNGEPKFISVDFNINDKSKTRRNLYDLNWELMDAEITYPKELNFKVEKPEKLQEMIKYSKKLSEGFSHVRVDFYYINKEIKFGEMTFYHQSGFGDIRPKEFAYKMGDWLELPENNK